MEKTDYAENIKTLLPVVKLFHKLVNNYTVEKQEEFDHLSEKVQESAKGEALEDMINNLSDATDSLDEAISLIEEALEG